MVCGIYQAEVGKESIQSFPGERAGMLLSVKQGSQALERQDQIGGRATVQIVRVCAGR